MVFLLLLRVAFSWKNFVFLSPSFNHTACDLCLQYNSSFSKSSSISLRSLLYSSSLFCVGNSCCIVDSWPSISLTLMQVLLKLKRSDESNTSFTFFKFSRALHPLTHVASTNFSHSVSFDQASLNLKAQQFELEYDLLTARDNDLGSFYVRGSPWHSGTCLVNPQ